MDPDVVNCACGATTRRSTSRRNAQGDVVACWLRLDEHGEIQPGCRPDERTAEVMERRAARARGQCDRVTLVRRFPGMALIDCQCGRRTVVHAARFLPVDLVPHPAPPDPRVPYYAPACWLAIDPDGTTAPGCKPDINAWDVVARARHRRGLPPHPDEPRQYVPELVAATLAKTRPATLLGPESTTEAPPVSIPAPQSAPAPVAPEPEPAPQLAFF